MHSNLTDPGVQPVRAIPGRRTGPVRRALILLVVVVWFTTAAAPALGGSAVPGTVIRVGSGASRLTIEASGGGTLYVNLKGLAPGRWNEHLWTGTCSALGARVAILPGLAVPPSGTIARTNRLTPQQALGRTLRLVHGTSVLCATFPSGKPPSSGPVVVVGAGDIAGCGFTSDTMTGDLIESLPGAQVVTMGDNTYPDGTIDQFNACYADSWGRFRSRTRPVPGNHDYGTPDAAGYFEYFGSLAGPPGQGWYAFDIGDWRIYMLNSNCEAVGACGLGSAQEVWLRADLGAHPHTCTAAIWHHPRFSSGEHGNDPRFDVFWKNLYAAGAELVLNGHDHDYERFAPLDPSGNTDLARGITELVVGTGGVGHNVFTGQVPGSEVRNSDTFGVIKLTLAPTSFSWEFLPIAGQTFTDRGTRPCH